jgi:hypothetical protein
LHFKYNTMWNGSFLLMFVKFSKCIMSLSVHFFP